jgi:DNA-binding GntR family transcriptional regulator
MKTEPPRINDAVYKILKSNIEQNRIPCGVRIRETDVARLLDVGRVPVRAALARLEGEAILVNAPGQGYVRTGKAPSAVVRFADLELDIDPELLEILGNRNWRMRIFDEAELTVASALVFGAYSISEARLAGHYGVSRTIAREFLSRIERVGLVAQLPNGRWQAGPMTDKDIRDHYAMRCALEPLALREVAPTLEKTLVGKMIDRLEKAQYEIETVTTDDILRLEKDLHVDIVLGGTNRPMNDAIHRSQLPLISTHISFVATQSYDIVENTINEHLAIAFELKAGNGKAASQLLEQHLIRARETTLRRLSDLQDSHLPNRPDFLVPL